jgi:MraZ protein
VISGEFWGIMGESDGHTDTLEALGFTGNFPLRMDSAQRVAVPAKFREVLDKKYDSTKDQVVLLPDMGKVKVLPMPVWEVVKKKLETLPDFDPSSDEFRTYIFGNMTVCQLDAQNRIRLTPGLCDLAGLQKEVVVVGQQDRMEIWDAVRWKEFNAATSRNLREMMSQVFRNQQQGSGQ